jgi:hypothetical protein
MSGSGHRLAGQVECLRAALHHPVPPSRLWLGPCCVGVAWAGLAAAMVFPPRGAGIPLCWIHGTLDVPCPGCGLMRSLSCAVRGLWMESLDRHPLGLVILALFLFTASQSLLPRSLRQRLLHFMDRRGRWFSTLYLAFVVLFVSFGALRALWHGAGHWLALSS